MGRVADTMTRIRTGSLRHFNKWLVGYISTSQNHNGMIKGGTTSSLNMYDEA
jgi:hypothetical protein